MNDIEIRLAEFRDVPVIREVAILSYEATFAEFNTRENMEAFYKDSYSLEKLQNEFYEQGSVLYLAFVGKALVGFFAYERARR